MVRVRVGLVGLVGGWVRGRVRVGLGWGRVRVGVGG